ncbi:octaprenyl diphosphate synthase [Endozoicomonas euniceicola]|uniref:Octaprenyl diphosphate synthase n=1 Tax=Endozoicomonas euniceicola TaxID=1234143 RepID=A0ABY6GR84_9GAMM|nr:octaprenyl diphosphate synthase [Endozoicomonas euniceicola]UYM15262.1 octaprenyl diphosphate synthase [Endozoicomonas euniceicola]
MPDRKQPSFQAVVRDDFALVDQCIREQLHSDVALVSKIGQYIIQSGGKRLRPLLVLLTANACGYNARGHNGKNHIPLAAVIEFLHTATLLHDDVVDQSDLRRGRDTANALWGNAPSILVGDFLYSRAFQMMVGLDNMRLLNVLANATNVIAEGEVMQLMNINDSSVTEAQYMEVIRCKTAMLFEASTHTAAILSGQNKKTEQALCDYGNHLGMAFQLVDDLLDYGGDAEAMGKNLGDDLAEGKPTLPLIFTLSEGKPEQKELVRQAIEEGNGLDNMETIITAVRDCGALGYTAQRAQEQAQKAITSLSVLPESPYRSAMEELANFAVARTY